MIIGHKKQQEKLNLLFQKNQIPHAFLFSGPEGVGKRAVALWFLKMINCEKENSPCGKCRNCYEIEEKIHPDILQVFSEKKEITVEQIAEIVEKVSFKNIKAKFKGILIDEAHLMNTSAQNALLKTLEEPSPNTVIIIVTEYPQMLLPTILSRVFEINFSFVSEKEIEKGIGNAEIAKISFGKPGLAKNLLLFPERKKEIINIKNEVKELINNDLSTRFAIIKKVVTEERAKEFLYSLLRELREKMLLFISSKENNTYIEIIKEIEEIIFLHSKTNINIQLALEKIAVKIK
jgi:DNA polymerase III delta' subunit